MFEVKMLLHGRVQTTHETPSWADRLAAKKFMMDYGTKDAKAYGADWFQLFENGTAITARKATT